MRAPRGPGAKEPAEARTSSRPRGSASRSRSRGPSAASTSCGPTTARPAAARGEVAFGPVPCAALRRHGPDPCEPRPHDLHAGLRRLRRRRGPHARARASAAAARAGSCRASGSTSRSPPGRPPAAACASRAAATPGAAAGLPATSSSTVEVEAHPVYRREGDDLHCAVPVTMVEAALGGHVEVPTPRRPGDDRDPRRARRPASAFACASGAPRSSARSARGDLYVEARVVVPAVTDDRSRALLGRSPA